MAVQGARHLVARRGAGGDPAPGPRPIDEQHAVQVVEFVLEDPRQKSRPPHDDPSPPEGPAVELHAARAADHADRSGDAEAPFGTNLRAPPAPHPGIDNHDRARSRVRHHHAERHAHLNRGEAHPSGVAHCREHVCNEAPDRRINGGDRTAPRSENPMLGISKRHDAPGPPAYPMQAGNRTSPLWGGLREAFLHGAYSWWRTCENPCGGLRRNQDWAYSVDQGCRGQSAR